MKPNHPLDLFLSGGAEGFRGLTGGRALKAPTVLFADDQGLGARRDGIFDPDGHAGPVGMRDFQGQQSDKAWYHLRTKIGL